MKLKKYNVTVGKRKSANKYGRVLNVHALNRNIKPISVAVRSKA